MIALYFGYCYLRLASLFQNDNSMEIFFFSFFREGKQMNVDKNFLENVNSNYIVLKNYNQ